MAHQFKTHYTRDEARRLLPQLRKWLERLVRLRGEIEEQERRLERLRKAGSDLGGAAVGAWVRALAEVRTVLFEFYQREIQIKDLGRGLVDFPAIIDGREVFLCWEQDEEDIEFWHDLDAGYAGRERLKD
jgi:hypothetical protein